MSIYSRFKQPMVLRRPLELGQDLPAFVMDEVVVPATEQTTPARDGASETSYVTTF